MKGIFLKKILIIVLFSLLNKLSYTDNKSIALYDLQPLKRNKASCDRLGNIYDACQWMMKFTIENNSSKTLESFCSLIKINKKKYEVCSSKAFNKKALKPNHSKRILINLTELIKYENNYRKPSIILVKITGSFSKSAP
jgi:hypothetical protein